MHWNILKLFDYKLFLFFQIDTQNIINYLANTLLRIEIFDISENQGGKRYMVAKLIQNKAQSTRLRLNYGFI